MKNTLKILVVSAIFGAILAGCGTPAEGNNDASNTVTPPTANGDKKPMSGVNATSTPPTDTKAPAGDTKAPAGDTKAPAGDAKAPAGDANAPAPDATKK